MACWDASPDGTSQIVVINGMFKPNAAPFSDREYEKSVCDLGADYFARLPRPIV